MYQRRLPPLEAIGRSEGVDSDEPPELLESNDDDEDIVSASASQALSLPLDASSTNDIANSLSTIFKIQEPGGYICLRNRSSGTGLTHCRKSLTLSQTYAELIFRLEKQAYLNLVRDYIFRIHSVCVFVKQLQLWYKEEVANLHGILHDSTYEPSTSNILKLQVICDELRIHVFHWSSVKQRLLTDRWLASRRNEFIREIDSVKNKLCLLQHQACSWTEKLIQVGLEVVAHLDAKSITTDGLNSITRGIEEFNSVIGCYQNCGLGTRNISVKDAIQLPSNNHCTSLVKTTPLSKILHLLARARSTEAVKAVGQFFGHSEEFMHLIVSTKIEQYPRLDYFSIEFSMPSRKFETSDYQSGTASSQASLESFLKVGNSSAPDLSHKDSPLLKFLGFEENLIMEFLTAVCASTNLVRRNKINKLPKHKNHDKSQNVALKRKKVSWSDNLDSSMKNHLMNRYLELMWQSFGDQLLDYFESHRWGEHCPCLGSTTVAPLSVVIMLGQMIRQTTMKDLFPQGSDHHLLTVAGKIQSQGMLHSWDLAYCEALSSSVTDKYYPCLLAENCCTKTAKLLRDCFQILISLLHILIQNNKEKAASDLPQISHLPLLLPVMIRLLKTSQVVLNWCSSKCQQLLSSRSLGAFLLVSQSDMQILKDEICKAVNLAQPLCEAKDGVSPNDLLLHSRLQTLLVEVSAINGSMQTLSGSVFKKFANNITEISQEFFSDALPVGRYWRQKTQVFPNEQSDYVKHAINDILKPILDGVAKLKKTIQITVTSVTVTKMSEAWTTAILKEKIRFSLQGAHQLQVDFLGFRTWLDSYIENDGVKQSVLSLDVFKYLESIVILLKRQQIKNQVSKLKDQTEERGADYSAGGSLAIADCMPEPVPQDWGEELDVNPYYMKHMDDWLALRVHGGSRLWKIQHCFPSS